MKQVIDKETGLVIEITTLCMHANGRTMKASLLPNGPYAFGETEEEAIAACYSFAKEAFGVS